MKKLIIALVVMAIASVASAELLASWTFAGGNGTSSLNTGAANIGQITVGNLARVGLGTSSTAAGQFSSNGWDDGGQVEFSLTVNANYQIANAALNMTSVQGSNTGPRNTSWYLGAAAVGTVLTRTVSTTTSWNSSLGTIAAGAGQTLSIRATDSVSVTGGTPASAGSFRINDLSFNGDIQAVPEPATMSLLGLGALAMVLRRKMSK